MIKIRENIPFGFCLEKGTCPLQIPYKEAEKIISFTTH